MSVHYAGIPDARRKYIFSKGGQYEKEYIGSIDDLGNGSWLIRRRCS